MSTVDEDSMEPWVEDLRGEVERLKAEVVSLTYDRDAYASVALAGLSGLVCTPEKGYVKDGGYGLLKGDLHRLREKYKEAVASRDSCVGSYKACRNVMKAAGVPCNFGRDGEPTTDEGMGRDLADCVKSLVERMQTAEASLVALAAENQSLREQGRAVEAERDALVADMNMFGGALRYALMQCVDHDVPLDGGLEVIARRASEKTDAVFEACQAERDKLKLERSTLRSAFGSIHAIATDLHRETEDCGTLSSIDRFQVARIRDLAVRAIEVTNGEAPCPN